MQSRRERKKQQTRNALLEAAMSLLAERGIEGTRVSDITERVDLGKGAFYNYFSSKDALIAELVAQGVKTFQDEYLVYARSTAGVAERVSDLARLHTSFLNDHPQYALLFHQARGLLLLSETGAEPLRDVFGSYLRGVAQELMPSPDDDPTEEALDMAAALMGGIAGYRSFRIAAALTPSKSTAEEILTRGIPGMLRQRQEAQ